MSGKRKATLKEKFTIQTHKKLNSKAFISLSNSSKVAYWYIYTKRNGRNDNNSEYYFLFLILIIPCYHVKYFIKPRKKAWDFYRLCINNAK